MHVPVIHTMIFQCIIKLAQWNLFVLFFLTCKRFVKRTLYRVILFNCSTILLTYSILLKYTRFHCKISHKSYFILRVYQRYIAGYCDNQENVKWIRQKRSNAPRYSFFFELFMYIQSSNRALTCAQSGFLIPPWWAWKNQNYLKIIENLIENIFNKITTPENILQFFLTLVV